MPRQIEIPVNPRVVAWAIDRSGYSAGDVADRLGVPVTTVAAWVSGTARPGLTQFRELARILRRPTATFFLPTPPKDTGPEVSFRAPPGEDARALLPEERVRIREVERLQRTLAWIGRSLGEGGVDLPRFGMKSDPLEAAAAIRQKLAVTVEVQTEWKSDSEAFRGWRKAFEDAGILMFALPMGADSARGFSIWDEEAPLVAVNTHYNQAARVFTMFHEAGHLVTRTDSICLEDGRREELRDASEDIERWCERFAAAALMPSDAVESLLVNLGVTDVNLNLGIAKRVARHFRVSLRAAVIRVIDLGRATWGLFAAIPAMNDGKKGGGGGKGRNVAQVRLDEYGERTSRVLMRAWQRELLHPVDVMQHLDVTWEALEELRQRLSG